MIVNSQPCFERHTDSSLYIDEELFDTQEVIREIAHEGILQGTYTFNMLKKVSHIYAIGCETTSKGIKFTGDFLPQLYERIHSLVTSYFSKPTPATSSQLSNFIYQTGEQSTKRTLQFTALSLFRQFLFFKQTADFGIATVEWLKDRRDKGSVYHHATSLALCTLPFILPSHSVSNLIILGSLAFSIHRDYRLSTRPEERQPSPFMNWAKKTILPYFKSAISK